MRKYCANILQITCKYYANIVQILCKYCANMVQILGKYCANIGQIFCKCVRVQTGLQNSIQYKTEQSVNLYVTHSVKIHYIELRTQLKRWAAGGWVGGGWVNLTYSFQSKNFLNRLHVMTKLKNLGKLCMFLGEFSIKITPKLN